MSKITKITALAPGAPHGMEFIPIRADRIELQITMDPIAAFRVIERPDLEEPVVLGYIPHGWAVAIQRENY